MSSLLREFGVRIAPFVLLIFIWWAAVTAFGLPSRLMPGPGEVGMRIYRGLITEGDLWPHMSLTLITTLGGYLLGSVLGVIAGSLLAMSRVVELTTYPIVVLLQAVPKVAIAPLVLLWLGYETHSTVTLVALTCFFPVFVGTFVGIRSVPAVLRDLFRTLNASGIKTYLHLGLPNAAGSIVAGLQVGWGFALVGCVVMEFIMGMGGAGFLIDNSANMLDAVTAVAAMVLLGVMGYAGGMLLQWAKRRLIFWEGDARHG